MRNIILRSIFVAFSLAIAISMPGGAAYAQSESVTHYSSPHAPIRYPHYARAGSTIKTESHSHDIHLVNIPLCNRDDVECTEYKLGVPKVELECDEDAGAWEVKRASGACIQEFTFCTKPKIEGTKPICRTVIGKGTAQTLSIRTKSNGLQKSNCEGDENLGEPIEKQYCSFNYEGEEVLTTDTKDGLFAMKPGGGTYFVFKPVSTDPVYIYREPAEEGESADPIPLPTGPALNFAAYKKFLEEPEEPIHVEKACPPVDVKLCETMMPLALLPKLPSIDASCGVAHQDTSYQAMSDIPLEDLCNFGDAVTYTDFEGRLEWQCIPPKSLYSGETVECYAGEPINGQCGVAAKEGKTHESLALIEEEDLCLNARFATHKQETDNGISWECRGKNGGETAQCWAARQATSE
jgi:hypothetical protein